jgi:hypothetical protein
MIPRFPPVSFQQPGSTDPISRGIGLVRKPGAEDQLRPCLRGRLGLLINGADSRRL